jgi:hypothetical protein
MSNIASENDIVGHYHIDGYNKIVEMGYENNIMKNYKNAKYNGIKNYYPEGLSVEDIDNYIKENTGNEGINAYIFKTFKCAMRESDEYNGLLRKIRNRQLFETKLGIRDNLGNPAVACITTSSFPTTVVVPEKMDRVEEGEESLAVASEVMNGRPAEEEGEYERTHSDLVEMKREQDEWFSKVPIEDFKKLFFVNLPVYALFLGATLGCVIGSVHSATCCLGTGGKKKRKSKRKKYVKKKKITRKRKSIKRKTKKRYKKKV